MCAPIFNGKAPRIPFPEKKIKTHVKVTKKSRSYVEIYLTLNNTQSTDILAISRDIFTDPLFGNEGINSLFTD